MDFEFDESYIRRQLKQDEFIIWRGIPDKGVPIHFIDIVLSVFGMIILGFAVALWKTNFILEFSDVIYLGLAILITLIGSYFLFIRYFVEMWKRTKIYYLLTNQRLFITLGSRVHVVANHNVKNADIKYHRNDHVSVYFKDQPREVEKEAGLSFGCYALLNIANGQHVIDLMKNERPVESLPQVSSTQTKSLHLQNEEVILWKGVPAKGNLYYAKEFLLSLSGLAGVIFFGSIAFVGIGFEGLIESFPFSILPLIPLGFSCYVMFIRFIVEAIRRKDISYILTNKRLLIRYKEKEKTYFKKDLYAKEVTYYKNGNALIQIDRSNNIRVNNVPVNGYFAGMSDVDKALLNIENPKDVLSLMSQMEE